jgi:hypothetical protein
MEHEMTHNPGAPIRAIFDELDGLRERTNEGLAARLDRKS